MVTNTLLTIDEITQDALIVLKNSLGIANRCLREYDGNFGVEGAKIGDTMRIRKPVRYVSTNGPSPAQQGTTETFVPLQANNQLNIAVNYSSKELALALDDVSDRVTKPAMEQLASDIDMTCAQTVANGFSITNSGFFTANYAATYAGFYSLATPGSASALTGPAQWKGNVIGAAANSVQSAAQVFFDAAARLDEQAAPAGERFCVLSPAAMASTVPNLFVNFNPSAEISDMFRKGLMGDLAGALFHKTQNIPTFTSGTRLGTANASVVTYSANNGDTVISVNVASTQTVVVGDQFIITGVGSINPLNRLATGLPQVFTALTANTANATNVATFSIYPPLNFTSNANTNQNQTISALPTALMNVTWMGAANTLTQVNFMYQKNAIALGVAPLSTDLDGATVAQAVNEDDGLALRYVKQYAIASDQRITRYDILFGVSVVRPELGCRIQA